MVWYDIIKLIDFIYFQTPCVPYLQIQIRAGWSTQKFNYAQLLKLDAKNSGKVEGHCQYKQEQL